MPEKQPGRAEGRFPGEPRCAKMQLTHRCGPAHGDLALRMSPEFFILGPLEVQAGDSRLHLGGMRQRTILAVLLLEANHVVPVDRLIQAVWEDQPPTTARNQIAICVSTLRRVLSGVGSEGELIATRFPGYCLRAEPGQLDAQVAEESIAQARIAVRQGERAEAISLFRGAVALWRGPVLGGLESSMVAAKASRFDELRLAALEECMQLELERDGHYDVADELASLVADNPLRERLRAQLMIALSRVGRRAEALEAYRDGRRLLIDELGLEPGPELQRIHEAILREDGTAESAASPNITITSVSTEKGTGSTASANVPTQLPPAISGFAGRHRELQAIGSLVGDRADHKGPPVILITGIGGVGKTALAVTWAHRAVDDFPDGQLFVDLRGYDESNEPLQSATVLDRLLRAMGIFGDRIPDDLDARSSLFRSVLNGRRMLIMLDNAASSEQVRPLIPGNGKCLVLVTSRHSLDGLVAGEGARVLSLGVLDQDTATELLAGVVTDVRVEQDPAGATRLAKLCEGHPLALRVAAARMVARPHWTFSDLTSRLADERRRLDELSRGEVKVRSCLELSCRGLTPAAVMMFRRLGLLQAPDFPAWAGAAVLDTSEPHARDLIEDLLDARLLEVAGHDSLGRVRYRFHDLVRLYAKERAFAEEPEHERSEAIARALQCWLALAEEAHRLEYGGDYTVIHGSARRWRPESFVDEDLLARPLAWLEAERAALVSAVRQAAECGFDELSWDLACTAVTLFEARCFFDDWRDTSESALAATRQAKNRRGEAAILHSLGNLHMFQQRYAQAEELFDCASQLFQDVGERHGYALVLRNSALLHRVRGRLDLAKNRYTEAEIALRHAGDLYAQANSKVGIAQVHLEQGELEAGEVSLRAALDIFQNIGSRLGESQALCRLGELLVRREKHNAAQQELERALEIVQSREDRVGEAYIMEILGESQAGQGLYDEAEESLSMSLRISMELAERFIEARSRMTLGKIHAAQADFEHACTELEKATFLFGQMQASSWREKSSSILNSILTRKK